MKVNLIKPNVDPILFIGVDDFCMQFIIETDDPRGAGKLALQTRSFCEEIAKRYKIPVRAAYHDHPVLIVTGSREATMLFEMYRKLEEMSNAN